MIVVLGKREDVAEFLEQRTDFSVPDRLAERFTFPDCVLGEHRSDSLGIVQVVAYFAIARF